MGFIFLSIKVAHAQICMFLKRNASFHQEFLDTVTALEVKKTGSFFKVAICSLYFLMCS